MGINPPFDGFPRCIFPSNLLSNPYVCDCHLAWLGQWLKKTRVVSGNPRCQKPAFLKEIPIQDVAAPDFTCDSKPLFRPLWVSPAPVCVWPPFGLFKGEQKVPPSFRLNIKCCHWLFSILLTEHK